MWDAIEVKFLLVPEGHRPQLAEVVEPDPEVLNIALAVAAAGNHRPGPAGVVTDSRRNGG